MTGSLTSAEPKMSFRRRRPMGRSLNSNRSPGYSRHDRDLVPIGTFGLEPRAQADVLVVQVEVDELPELAFIVEQAVSESRIALVQGRDRGLDVGRIDAHRDLAVGKAGQRAGDAE